MNRRPTINRGDLLRCLAGLPPQGQRQVAELCGFARAESPEPLPEPVPPESARPALAPPPISPPPAAISSGPSADIKLQLLVPTEAVTLKPSEVVLRGGPDWLKNAVPFEASELEGKDEPPPSAPALQAWARLWPWLRQALGAERESHRLDTQELLREAARLRPLHRLPRQRMLAWAEHATLLLDARATLALFHDDMDTLVRHLTRLRGAEGLSCAWLLEGTPTGEVRRFRDGKRCAATAPPGTPVLVLSDLGNLSQDDRLRRVWRQQAQSWRRQGSACAALLPCPRDRWEAALARAWRSAGWDRGERPPAHGGQAPRAPDLDRPNPVERLLDLLAPALRIEPGLLRSLRFRLSAEGADVGTEFNTWHHADAARTPFAFALRPDAAVRRQPKFEAECASDKAAVAELLRRFHAGCGPALRHRETLNLHAGGVELSAKELAAATETQARLVATMFQQARTPQPAAILELGLLDWMRREVPRLPPASRDAKTPVAAGWALVQYLAGGPPEAAPEGIVTSEVAWVPDLLLSDPGEPVLWEVRCQGAALVVRPWGGPPRSSAPSALTTGAPLAWLWMQRARLVLTASLGKGETHSWIILPQASGETRLPVGTAQRLALASDCGEVTFAVWAKPDWATRFGQEQAGTFAEFAVEGVVFRLRWIPPGSFLMGSPESEAGRFTDEMLHRVTLSRGFWLADTPCTQAQWQAVMGENPCEFKQPYEPKRPVESVDWEQCRQFCARLRERIPDLDFRLPTEAEWEYACRAGTTSAFNDGSPCTQPTGRDPALERLGWFGEDVEKGKTHPVVEKLANAWGLYDMHGNVWEWCLDSADWKDAVVTDTYVEGGVDPLCEHGARRVVRGGSSWDGAGICRSAYRSTGGPVYRRGDLGFRLAAGQPPAGRGAPGSAAGGAAAPVPEAPAARPASGASRPAKKTQAGR